MKAFFRKASLFAMLVVLGFSATQAEAQQRKTNGRVSKKFVMSEEGQEMEYEYNSPKPSSMLNKNALSVELLGRGIGYGVMYDRTISPSLALGIGYTSLGGSLEYSDGIRDSFRVTIIPLYLNYYFQPNRHRGFLTAGMSYLGVEGHYTKSITRSTGSADKIDTMYLDGSTVVPSIGGGYEFRSRWGFLFRAAAYVHITPGAVLPWPGISFGGVF